MADQGGRPYHRQMSSPTGIQEVLAKIALPKALPIPLGMGGIAASLICTPCRAPCLHASAYLGYHLIPAQLAKMIHLGMDDRSLIARVERATPHVPIGHCPCCGSPGRETVSASLAEFAQRFDLGEPAEDESYEHWAVWFTRTGNRGWTELYRHWSQIDHSSSQP